jgi:hypothetical protein
MSSKRERDACLAATLRAIFEADDTKARELAYRSGELFVDYIRARMAARAAGLNPDDDGGTLH